MRIIRWLIGAIVLTLVALTLVPFALRWYLIVELEAMGNQAQIRHIGFDFIQREITLYDVQVRTVDGDEFSVFSATFKLDFLAMLEKRIVIENASINTAHVDARRVGDTWVVAGIGRALSEPKYGGDFTVEINNLSVENSELCRQNQTQCLRIEQGYLNRAKLVRQAKLWSLTHDGQLRLVKTFLRERTSNSTLFYAGELNVESGVYSAELLNLKNVRFQNVQFIESELDKNGADAPYQTQVGDLLFASIHWQRVGEMDSLKLGPVAATSLRQALQKNAQSELVLPIRVRLWANRFARKFAANKLHFTLAELNATDGAFVWADQSVTPTAVGNIAAITLRLGAIDSAVPATPTSFSVRGKLGDRGQLKFEGDVFPFMKLGQFSITGSVESFHIDGLAGYSLGLLGQRVKKGEIDVAFNITANKGRVNATSRWQWTDFVIESGRGSNGGHMPLETAFEILKDHNASIRFDLNVSGDVGTKALDIHNIFANQVRGILSKMARGQVSAVGESNSNVGQANLTFAPLFYAVNARYLADAEVTRLSEIAALLVSKPQLKMTFCPIATGGEWRALFYANGNAPAGDAQMSAEQEQSLLGLSSARGRALLSTLLEEGVGVHQIVICNPRLDLTQSGMSYISVSL